jgi:hypothetical protein
MLNRAGPHALELLAAKRSHTQAKSIRVLFLRKIEQKKHELSSQCEDGGDHGLPYAA